MPVGFSLFSLYLKKTLMKKSVRKKSNKDSLFAEYVGSEMLSKTHVKFQLPVCLSHSSNEVT